MSYEGQIFSLRTLLSCSPLSIVLVPTAELYSLAAFSEFRFSTGIMSSEHALNIKMLFNGSLRKQARDPKQPLECPCRGPMKGKYMEKCIKKTNEKWQMHISMRELSSE